MRTITRTLGWAGAAALALAACGDGGGDRPRAAAPGGERGPAAEAWCDEHGVPESKCTLCKPRLIPGFQEQGDWCGEHGLPESVCPICHPEKLQGHPTPSVFPARSPDAPSPARPPVRLAGEDVAEAAGIVASVAAVQRTSDDVSCLGRIAYDPGRLAALTSRVPGTVIRLAVSVGSAVAAGQPVAAVRSIELGEARARLRSARAAHDLARSLHEREQRLREIGVSTEPQVTDKRIAHEEARAALAAAAETVRLLADDPDGAAPAGEARASAGRAPAADLCGDEPACVTIRTPFAGTVTARPAFLGSFVHPDDVLAELADISVVWAELDVRDGDLPAVRGMVGATATLRVDGAGERTWSGAVAGIDPELDPRTRTARARIEGIGNADGALRVGMFLRATIRSGTERQAVLIPRDALQTLAGDTVAFVRLGPDLYEPRAVRVGRARGDLVEVLEGIGGGEPVVSVGGFLLKTEVLKDSIGAGCVDD